MIVNKVTSLPFKKILFAVLVCITIQTPLVFSELPTRAYAQGTSEEVDIGTEIVVENTQGNQLSGTLSCESGFKYKTLVNIPGLGTDGVVTICPSSLGLYLQIIFNYIIGIAIALAVVMIIYGGVIYSTTDALGKKGEGKTIITDALYGLALALGSFLILNTINPDLLKFDLNLPTVAKVDLETGGLAEVRRFESLQNGESAFGGALRNGKKIIMTLSNGQTFEAEACPAEDTACRARNLQTITFLGKQVTVSKTVVASLNRINAEWLRKGGNKFYQINTIESYNYRTVKDTGGRDTGKVSNHSYGLALDINRKTNLYHRTILTTDMPVEFRNLFIREGWGWGGNWNSSKDAMHFSKVGGGEGGNQRGD